LVDGFQCVVGTRRLHLQDLRIYQTTWWHNAGDRDLHSSGHEDPKSHYQNTCHLHIGATSCNRNL
jgi:hypothetical protein